jgi:Ca2+-transporting ATPase
LLGAGVAALVATTLVCELPFLANAFGFTAVSLAEYVIAIALGVLVIPIVEIVKFFQRMIAKR